MKKILFLIHDLGVGGAEKVLISLVNHMNREKFDITVAALFGGGVNEQFIAPHIKYYAVWPKAFPGNSKVMKILSPEQLHKICVREHYDIEIAYLEGPSARVISGCTDLNTKLFSWIHIEQHTPKCAAGSFRSFKESRTCYKRFDKIVCVSEFVKHDFLSIYPDLKSVEVRYNTIDTTKIVSLKKEAITDVVFREDEIKLVFVGKVSKNKGIDRLARIIKRLIERKMPVHLYVLGIGPYQAEIENYIRKNKLEQYFTFLGYQTNPYKYVAKCDLFVCASWAEGFSTAAVEALIVGTPVCTVNVSGMKEMLGENNEWGIVTDNNDKALYRGIYSLVSNSELLTRYRKKAEIRGQLFSTEKTVKAVEQLFENL